MATLVIPSCWQVSIQMLHSGRAIDNVIGIKAAGIHTTDEVGNAVKTAWEATGGPMSLHMTSTVMTGYKIVDLGSTTGAVSTVASAKAGSATGVSGLLSGAALVTFGNGTRSRSARGRMYHGPLTTTQAASDGRSLVATVQTALIAAYQQFDANLNTAGFEWVVLSRKYSIDHPISAITVSPLVATQRRRMRS